MEKPEYLEMIHEILDREVPPAIEKVQKIVELCTSTGPTYKNMRVVLVIDDQNNISICERRYKTDNQTEITLLKKRELKEGGFKSEYWAALMEKIAITLEKRGVVKRVHGVECQNQETLFNK
jgi:hypothetical protein